MDDRFKLTDDRIETRRALLKVLAYVEDECARAGFSASLRMVAMSRSILENELMHSSLLSFDKSGQPRLN